MNIYTSLTEAAQALSKPSIFCLGTFDGVHTGHKVVMDSALRYGHIHHLSTGVFTFSNHPQSVLSSTPPQLLSSFEERLAHFEAMGFHQVVCPPFDESLKNITAHNFLTSILRDTLHARAITIGYDFCFGQNRQGNGLYLKQEGLEQGITHTEIVEPVKVNDQIVSSTLIRKLLNYGDVQQANTLLGQSYTLKASIIKGKQNGRQLGFPTANLDTLQLKQHHRLIPAVGTYCGWGTIKNTPYMAVANIGYSPSVNGGTAQPRVEVHLLNYDGPQECYGESLEFSLVHRLRDEQTFNSLEALTTQIKTDTHQARQLLSSVVNHQPLPHLHQV